MAPESESLIIDDYHGGRVAEVHVAGAIEKADHLALVPELERLIEQHEKIRMLLQLHRFLGWQAGASWRDLPPSDWPSFPGVERLAIVANQRWRCGHSSFSGPFVHAWKQFFPTEKGHQARAWIDEGLSR